ncbi:Peptidyl-tRNA hydrolase [hydrothermal vent metagenome]|uniref:peptidyl-tRNA hydrolase n=1 Tax=hydrothermal vent metagenome TaxID=652676 RepID=A0A3B1C358_9ZZZZ
MSGKSTSVIRLIVGLGNPGTQYEDTRHNAGFWFVDLVADRYGGCFKTEAKFNGQVCRIQVADNECWLLKPSTFMNRSGQAVSSFARYYKIALDEILVAHDELDLPAGDLRLKLDGGHAGHNGLRDIMSAMGSGAFLRLRIGIDHPGDRDRVVDYVLSRPSREGADTVREGLDKASNALPLIVGGNFQKAMNSLHSLS